MNLVDLRLPKKTKTQLKKEMVPSGIQEKYPYGFRLNFDAEQIKKLPQLEKVKIGEKLNINAVGEVMEVRKVDRQSPENSQYSVEVQLKQIGVQGSSPKKDETLIGAIEKAKKGELK